MDREGIRQLLREVREGRLDVDDALERLRLEPLKQLGYATLDLQRALRRGFPEAVYGPGKTTEQVVGIVGQLCDAGQDVIVTRVDGDVFEAVRAVESRANYHERARMITVRSGSERKARPGVVVITAGTADLPVAEEAAITAEMMGNAVERIFDVGVAGIHRLVEHAERLQRANVIIAVAGMEGALPSIVAGLTDSPVIGVPTATGYGTGAGGRAALLTMLNSCASGLTVVNVDNGFGAGYAASLINRPK